MAAKAGADNAEPRILQPLRSHRPAPQPGAGGSKQGGALSSPPTAAPQRPCTARTQSRGWAAAPQRLLPGPGRGKRPERDRSRRRRRHLRPPAPRRRPARSRWRRAPRAPPAPAPTWPRPPAGRRPRRRQGAAPRPGLACGGPAGRWERGRAGAEGKEEGALGGQRRHKMAARAWLGGSEGGLQQPVRQSSGPSLLLRPCSSMELASTATFLQHSTQL